jgi:chaperonin GroEL
MITKVVFSNDARKLLLSGMDIAARAVGSTMGPKGKTVLIQKSDNSSPVVTKDGVTVSKSIKLKDPIQRMGAQLICEAANRTNEVAGDGTTTSTVLAYSLSSEGMKLLEAGYSSKELCEGIDKAAKIVDDYIISSSKKLTTKEEIENVGTISANGDKTIGKIIASAMEKVGHDGIITVEDAKGMNTSLEVVEGMQFDRGYLSPYFVTNNEKMHALYNDAYILVCDKKITTIKELIPILEKVMNAQKALLIIAEDIEGEALQGLVLNRVKSDLRVAAIRAPGYALHRLELLNDLCILTGATLFSTSTGNSLEKANLSDLGKCKKFVVDAKSTTIVGNSSTKDDIENHIVLLKEQLSDITLDVDDIQKLKSRIAKLSSGVAIIKVGGATETEMIERKFRIEDALNATKAAVEEGIIPGGGSVLANVSIFLSKEELCEGMKIVQRACQSPLRQIAKNADVSFSVIFNNITTSQDEKSCVGYNASNNSYENLIETGVIDPVKVTRTALKNAVSVAKTFLMLDAIVCEENE